jgi:hypothetical protein
VGRLPSLLLLAWAFSYTKLHVTIAFFLRRKYIPIDVTKVEDECAKAFVDVFTSSIDDPNAVVCCRSTSGDASINNPLICNPPVRQPLVVGAKCAVASMCLVDPPPCLISFHFPLFLVATIPPICTTISSIS